MNPRYIVKPGRCIARRADGKGLVTLHRTEEEPCKENSYATGEHALAPWEADYFTHTVALGLNHHESLATALTALIERFTPRSKIDGDVLREARAALDAYDHEKASRG